MQDFLESFQKEAIWRELQAQKRLNEQLTEKISNVQVGADLDSSLTTMLASKWSVLDAFFPSTDSDAAATSVYKDLIADDNDLVKLELRLDAILNRIQAANTPEGTFSKSLLTEAAQSLSKQRMLEQSQLKVSHLESKLLNTQAQLADTQRQLDRERSVIIQRMNAAVMQNDSKHQDEKPAANVVPDIQQSAISILQQAKKLDAVKEQCELLQVSVTMAKNEAQSLRQERLDLQHRLDQNLLDAQNVPEHMIAQSSVYQRLRKEADFLKAEVDVVKAKCTECMQEIEQLESSRKEHAEQIKAQEAEFRSTLEEDLKKSNTDLTRIRTHRDQLMQSLEVEKARRAKHDKTVSDLALTAKVNHSRVVCLLEDLRRIKLRIAATSNDPVLYKNILLCSEPQKADANSQSENGSTPSLPDTPDLVNSLQTRLAECEDKLETMRDSLEVKEEIVILNEELSTLRRKFEDLSRICGQDKDLRKELERKNSVIQKLELQIKSYQQTEDGLMMEIETTTKNFSRLESRQQEHASVIAHKDDMITKLLSEKTKYDQKLSVLNKEKDSHSNKVIALGKQTQRQTELLQQLEETEKLKAVAISDLERELAQQKVVTLTHERAAQESRGHIDALTVMIEKSANKYQEHNNAVREKEEIIDRIRGKVQSMEEEARTRDVQIKNARKRLQAANLSTDLNATVETPSDQEIAQLKSDLHDQKIITQCSICKLRLKNHVITKCMHVFCRQCIDERLESRQRKCMQCAGPFGASDVQLIYL